MSELKSKASQYWQHASELAKFLLDSHDGHLTVAMPLGLGKANHLINALYGLTKENSFYSLTILTALSLQTPSPKAGLSKVFFDPIAKRLYEGYPELHYARDLLSGSLPSNVEVSEFFLQAGAYLNNAHAQANYISANYSHVSGYLLEKGVDLVVQMVARDERMGRDLSLSCNPDITLELLAARKAGEVDFALIGEINDSLPFMPNDAQLPESEFTHLLEGECANATLFNVPKAAIQINEYAAGFHASSLVKDGGTLQIGIGSAGDAVAYALIMRHTDNVNYKRIIKALNANKDISHLHTAPFEVGLYGVSEMLVDVFLDLIEAGVVKREVNGTLIHGGFFLGPKSLYQRLREWPLEQRKKINMTAIGYINGAHIDFNRKQQNRQHARFINNAMKTTLLGAVVSDGLDSGKVVSGVGGQYDFVRQSFALKGARSIIMIKAVRISSGRQSSNVVWSYAHTTIPRHLRDIVINEYGIADLRGVRDEEVIRRMLSITDRQFQADLLATAKANNKLAQGVELEREWNTNTQANLATILAPFVDQNLLPDYPFGTDFTDLEQRLIPVLETLQDASRSKVALVKLAYKGWVANKKGIESHVQEAAKRMNLESVSSIKSKVMRAAFLGAYYQTHH